MAILLLFGSLGMAAIAGLAVVDITTDFMVNSIHLGFIVGMAINTGKEAVIGSQMAVLTGKSGMFTGSYGKVMVEYGLAPGNMGGKMAEFTLGGESGTDVVGICG